MLDFCEDYDDFSNNDRKPTFVLNYFFIIFGTRAKWNILLSIVFSVKGGDFIQRKIDYSEYPFDPVQRNNLQLLGRTMVKKIVYQTLKAKTLNQ